MSELGNNTKETRKPGEESNRRAIQGDQEGRKTPEVNRTRKRWFSPQIPLVHKQRENSGWRFYIYRDDLEVARRRKLQGNQFGGKLSVFSLPFSSRMNRKESEITG